VGIDNQGNITFQTTAASAQTLTINPTTNVSGGVNFTQIVEFATPRRAGTLDTTNLDFSTVPVRPASPSRWTTRRQSRSSLNEDYRASGGPAAGLGEFAESGIEALEDEIQKQINASGLDGA
jgi:hypothetical protein